jgi:ABC-type transport system involved in multi-copper enzyme maturation permease subunit
MRKSIKWTLIGIGIFVAVVIVAVIILFVGLFISAGVSAIKEVSTHETKHVEQAEEEVATEEIEKLEDEKTTGSQGISEELETGQEFIYDGRKITLTKYEIVPTNTIDKNLLLVYLYVENIDNVPHEHIYDMDFTIYHNGREDGVLIGFGLGEGRKYYSTGEYRELNPGEVFEGWIDSFIPTDWKAEDIEIHFKPMMSGTQCIWVLK